MKKFLDNLVGVRKLSFGIIFLVVATVLLVMEYIPSDNWLQQMTMVVVAFFGTNLGERIISVTKDYLDNKNIDSVIKGAKDKLGL